MTAQITTSTARPPRSRAVARAPRAADPVAATLWWAAQHLDEMPTVAGLARRAHMSTRTFTRKVRAAVGMTPRDWLVNVRVGRARELLETTTWPLEQVARASGFPSETTFRHHFGRAVHETPGRYRRAALRRSEAPCG